MEIKDRYDPAAIRDLFDEMSATYGAVNLISSFGFTVRWRNQALRSIPITEALHVVDLMSGMNELCRTLSRHTSPSLHVTAVDISPEMAHRARKNWPFHVETKIEDVLALGTSNQVPQTQSSLRSALKPSTPINKCNWRESSPACSGPEATFLSSKSPYLQLTSCARCTCSI